MDLRFTPEENAFRAEVRAFIEGALPASIREKMIEGRGLSKQEMIDWQRILNAKGWAVPHWPKEWGGTEWGPVKTYLFREEIQQTPAPEPLPFGVNMLGPVLIAFGSEKQKKHFLPRIANLDDWWCQGFSEPGAGSDLASLKTSAQARQRPLRRQRPEDLDDAARSTPTGSSAWCAPMRPRKKQEGISFLLMDMKTPGITVRPIQTIDGGHEVNEVFFDDVKVPAENLVGEENKGWNYAKFLLGNERTGIARIGASKARIRRLKELAALEQSGGKPLIADERFRAKIAAVEVELKALEMTRTARGRRPQPPRQQAKSGLFRAQDQGLGNSADHHRAAARSGRPLRAARSGSARRERTLERAADRPRLGRPAGAAIFQLPQDLDLRRLQRDPEEHHRQGHSRTLRLSMSREEDLLKRVYAGFNSRDVDGVLAALHADVMWANGLDGGHVRGHDGVRRYWTRQWQTIDPHVEPLTSSAGPDGKLAVEVRQTVRDRNGSLLSDKVVGHVFQIEDGLIRRFDIRPT